MAEYADREHYIPLRKTDLIKLLSTDKQLPVQEREPLRRFSQLVVGMFHFEYLKQLEELKDAYAPFDPDTETRPLENVTPDMRDMQLNRLFDSFVRLMERANFKHMKWSDVQAAMTGGASDWGVNMYVTPELYERIEIFSRGDAKSTRTRRRLRNLWRAEEVKVATYQRLIFMVKLRQHKNHGNNANLKDVYIKAFKDIPKLDLEMLLPGAVLEMPRFTRLKLQGSLLGGLGFLVYKIVFEMWAAIFGAVKLGLLAAGPVLWAPVAALGGYGYKQYYSYSTTRQAYSLQLTQSLYYQNLDNNAGVLTRLLDEAEEQECRETLLGYFCLWRFAPPQGWTAEQLDDYVELYLEGSANLKVDFEIGDALAKLERLQLVEKTGSLYRAVPLATALQHVEGIWHQAIKEGSLRH
jgi:hypothetical protein